jgi:BirA family biotin operon repressor/biotin-[acetyl-CoA-carboxylase] ligase
VGKELSLIGTEREATTLRHAQPLIWRRVAQSVAGQTIGRALVYLESTGSTNDVARDLAAHGEPEGIAVVAEAQTAGRGRAGKSPWLTPPYTSIAVSVLLRPPLAAAALPHLAMLAGVAAVTATRRETGVPAALKWPNDVVVGGRKLGGILVESAMAGSQVGYAVLGIGLNGNFAAAELGTLPDAALPPATLQQEMGRPIAREALLTALLQELERGYSQIRAGAPHAIWERYRGVLGTLGQPVRIVAGATVDGVAETITPEGALVVRLPSGARRTFAFGEVSVRPSDENVTTSPPPGNGRRRPDAPGHPAT